MAKAAKRANPVTLRQGMSIGTGNAESDDEFLFTCFVNYPAVDICMRVQSPGMIVAGRTGSGKTAILRHIQRESDHVVEIDPSEMSMNYVSNSDALRFLNAIGADLDLLFQVLWKHVLCIEFIRLRWRVDNEEKSRNAFLRLTDKFSKDDRKKRAVTYLRTWENKFWITMDQNVKEITETTEKKLHAEMGADIEKFKAGGQYDKRLSVEKKSELVARARGIINSDQLTELHGIIEMLADQVGLDSMQKYYMLIDRLDEKWVDDSIRFRLIRGLMISLKSFRKIQNLKILVSLRTDVLERVVQETQDITFQREKFEDYFVKIKWSKSDLFELVDLRIGELFKRQYTASVIRFSDIFTSKISNQDPFDYIVDRTLMRPRDVIAFVNECIDASDGGFEITATHMRKAEVDYARKRRDALEQEWKSAFPAFRKLLDYVANRKVVSIQVASLMAEAELEELAFSISSDPSLAKDPVFGHSSVFFEGDRRNALSFIREIAATLYRVGAVGLKLSSGERFLYSHLDDPLISIDLITSESKLRLHPMLHGAYRLQSVNETP